MIVVKNEKKKRFLLIYLMNLSYTVKGNCPKGQMDMFREHLIVTFGIDQGHLKQTTIDSMPYVVYNIFRKEMSNKR